MAESPSWEKLVPKSKPPESLAKLIIPRLSILPKDSKEEADFTIITNEEPVRDLRVILPKLK